MVCVCVWLPTETFRIRLDEGGPTRVHFVVVDEYFIAQEERLATPPIGYQVART